MLRTTFLGTSLLLFTVACQPLGSGGGDTDSSGPPGSSGGFGNDSGEMMPGSSGGLPGEMGPHDPDAPGEFSEPISTEAALRKVKGVLTGLPPTDDEIAHATDQAALASLIDGWMETPEFEKKMLFFFSNAFQQSSLNIMDFQSQLRNRPGAFNLAYSIYGDSAFPMLFKNMKESFARTALEFSKQGRPLSDLLTTNEFMMTTALKSLYMQIEANWDTASDPNVMKWRFNYGRRPPIEDTLNPNHPDFMVFGHEDPSTITRGRVFNDNCTGNSNIVSQFPGNVYLFHLMLGHVGRDTGSNSPGQTGTGCWERATKPYFSPEDLSDWQMVRISRGPRIEPWDLPALRNSGGEITTGASRVSFFTTPAFLAVWNTNDSNAHRVTANQALLVALGQGFTSAEQSIPVPPDLAALNGEHAVDDSECYVCHKSLDPMSQFFNNYYFFSDRPSGANGNGPQASFGFGNVSENGRSLEDFGSLLLQVKDERVAGDELARFGVEMTQKLCYFANSSKCEEFDPEMRRVARAFEESQFDFSVLVRELFSSPLVTAFENTETFRRNGVTISVVRRDQLCQALSSRMGVQDVCENELPTPPARASSRNLLAGALPSDAFSRGVPEPVTASDPNIFYRGASELLCESIAESFVDAGDAPPFSSSNTEAALDDLVIHLMGLPLSDPHHAGARAILASHLQAALDSGASPTNALRSTFSAACQSPTSLAFGI